MSDYDTQRAKAELRGAYAELKLLRAVLRTARRHHVTLEGGTEDSFAAKCGLKTWHIRSLIGSYEDGVRHADGE